MSCRLRACLPYTFNIAAGIHNIGFLETQFSTAVIFTLVDHWLWKFTNDSEDVQKTLTLSEVWWNSAKHFWNQPPPKVVPFFGPPDLSLVCLFMIVLICKVQLSTKVGFSGCDFCLKTIMEDIISTAKQRMYIVRLFYYKGSKQLATMMNKSFVLSVLMFCMPVLFPSLYVKDKD